MLGCCTAERRTEVDTDSVSRLKWILEEVDRTRDMKPLIEQLSEDVVFRVTIPEGTPVSGEFRGKEAVTKYFAETLPAVAVFKQQVPMEFVADGDRVIVLGDDAYSLKKTGETFRSPYAMIVNYEGERIKSILVIQDLSGLAMAYREQRR
jgi:ketosteroid isomerase-like protein